MYKVKVFINNGTLMEQQVKQFLDANPSITITSVTQSSCASGTTVNFHLTIIYK